MTSLFGYSGKLSDGVQFDMYNGFKFNKSLENKFTEGSLSFWVYLKDRNENKKIFSFQYLEMTNKYIIFKPADAADKVKLDYGVLLPKGTFTETIIPWNDLKTEEVNQTVLNRYLNQDYLPLYQWHHIVISKDKSDITIYINGTVITVLNTNRLVTLNRFQGQFGKNDTDCYFGGTNMKIDQIREFNKGSHINKVKLLYEEPFYSLDQSPEPTVKPVNFTDKHIYDYAVENVDNKVYIFGGKKLSEKYVGFEYADKPFTYNLELVVTDFKTVNTLLTADDFARYKNEYPQLFTDLKTSFGSLYSNMIFQYNGYLFLYTGNYNIGEKRQRELYIIYDINAHKVVNHFFFDIVIPNYEGRRSIIFVNQRFNGRIMNLSFNRFNLTADTTESFKSEYTDNGKTYKYITRFRNNFQLYLTNTHLENIYESYIALMHPGIVASNFYFSITRNTCELSLRKLENYYNDKVFTKMIICRGSRDIDTCVYFNLDGELDSKLALGTQYNQSRVRILSKDGSSPLYDYGVSSFQRMGVIETGLDLGFFQLYFLLNPDTYTTPVAVAIKYKG